MEMWDRVIDVNLRGQWDMTIALLPALQKQGASLIFTASIAAFTAPRSSAAYGAAKAAQEVLLDAYAQEVRNITKIRVALVNPGPTRTKMRAVAYPGEDPASLKPPEVVANRLVALLTEDFASPHRETLPK